MKRFAVARPMPVEPPVITATFPVNLSAMLDSYISHFVYQLQSIEGKQPFALPFARRPRCDELNENVAVLRVHN
jgi:hypothetical protein